MTDMYCVFKMMKEYNMLLNVEAVYVFMEKLEQGISAKDTLKDP